MDSSSRDDLIRKLAANRRLAHQVLFQHRHPQATPPYHGDVVDLWHGPDEQVLTEIFRGGAKSTLAEEAIVIMALLREFKNCMIGGENETRAIEHLTAIKHEFETNEFIEDLFGVQVGATWQERKIVLQNGVCIQAIGRGQSMRGTKHLSWRPDLFFGDDMEDEESVATEEAREKVRIWFMRVVRPALAKVRRIRVAGTRIDPDSLIVRLQNSKYWKSVRIPIESKDPVTGERVATWGEHKSLEQIDQLKQEYIDAGDLAGFMQEYMCEASDPATRVFNESMVKVDAIVRTWHAVYAMYDPARSTDKNKSATTGWAAWSWVANRCIVWDAGGGFWKPDEIVRDIFRVNEEYRPISIGVEQTGLHEFIMQPLRAEQIRRGTLIPVQALNAPALGQIGVIKGLQPFFKAGEIVFAKELPELVKQMLSFPTGHRDTLNALAYAPRLRPGLPVYDGFRADHVSDSVEIRPREQAYLAVGATGQYTTAVLMQFVNGVLYVSKDWVCEGDPGATLSSIVQSASLVARRAMRLVAGPQHFDPHDTVGLRAAARKVPIQLDRGSSVDRGREQLRSLLAASPHGIPALQVHPDARWTLNALAGGYCRDVTKAGVVTEFAVDGPYRVLMEAVESFAGQMRTGLDEGDNARNYDYTPQGKRYLSALAGAARPMPEVKISRR